MDDERIVELYFERSEAAIEQTHKKYGNYCHKIAYNVLFSHPDAEECVNDTYLRAWSAIPPQRPSRLAAFLGKITRNLALDRYFAAKAKKRAPNSKRRDGEAEEPEVASTSKSNFAHDLNLRFDFSLRNQNAIRRDLQTSLSEATSGSKAFKTSAAVEYTVSRMVSLSLYYDRQRSEPLLSSSSYPTVTQDFGMSMKFSLTR